MFCLFLEVLFLVLNIKVIIWLYVSNKIEAEYTCFLWPVKYSNFKIFLLRDGRMLFDYLADKHGVSGLLKKLFKKKNCLVVML